MNSPPLLFPQEVRGGLLSAIDTVTGCLSNAAGAAVGRHLEAPVCRHGTAADVFADPVFRRPPAPTEPLPLVCATVCAGSKQPRAKLSTN